jgi:hypothetical protein
MTKPEKPPADPELARRIQELIDYKGGGYNEENVADIIDNALKLLKDVQDSGDVRVIKTALRELRYAFKLFAPYAQVRKVTMFGSARTAPTRPEYQQAVEFGRKIAAAGFMALLNLTALISVAIGFANLLLSLLTGAAATKQTGPFCQQLPLPLAHLIGMHPLLAGHLIDRLVPFDRLQRHSPFELRTVVISFPHHRRPHHHRLLPPRLLHPWFRMSAWLPVTLLQ